MTIVGISNPVGSRKFIQHRIQQSIYPVVAPVLPIGGAGCAI